MSPDNRIARVVGILFLLQMAAAITGNILIASSTSSAHFLINIDSNPLGLGFAALALFLCFGSVIAIGVLIYPVLKKHNPAIAISYIATRLVESIVQIMGVVAILSLIPLSRQHMNVADSERSPILTAARAALDFHWYSYLSAMIFLGVGSLFFCYLLYRVRLVPKWLAVLGFLGYFILAVTSALSIFGFDMKIYVSVPVFFFEVILGIWLILKGFIQRRPM